MEPKARGKSRKTQKCGVCNRPITSRTFKSNNRTCYSDICKDRMRVHHERTMIPGMNTGDWD